MMRLLRTMPVLFASVLLFGCTSVPQVDLDAERASLQAAAEAYHAAGNPIDIEAMMTLYAEDSRIIPPGRLEIRGLEDIREWMSEFVDLTNFNAVFETPTIQVSAAGGYGYSLATATLSYDDPDGEQVSETVRDLHVWEKHPDGSWKVVVDIWNEAPGPESSSEDM